MEPTDASTPAELLDEIAEKVRAAAHDRERLIDIGAGVLESMFHQGYAEEVWPEIVRLAETEPPFLTALGAVWAKHPNPQALLWHLGYWRRFTFTGVLYDSPGEPFDLGYRALQVEGFDRAQLPQRPTRPPHPDPPTLKSEEPDIRGGGFDSGVLKLLLGFQTRSL